MKLLQTSTARSESGSSVTFLILVLLMVWAIAASAVYVTSTTTLQNRRNSLVAAVEYADGGAVIAAADLAKALTNFSSSILTNLITNASGSYALNNSLSTSASNVLERTISSPFSNQTVFAQIWLTNSTQPTTARVVTRATVGQVTQTSIANLQMGFPYGAAVISVNAGSTDTSVSKNSAKDDGNVVVSGGNASRTIVDGNTGLAILANGRANVDATNQATVPVTSISMTNGGTVNELPDYTSQGTANTLFDIGRFIAVANATTNGVAPSGNNHFTNVANFVTACNAHPPANKMEGVIVVDIDDGDKNMGDMTDSKIPLGINVTGTLVFNFLGTGWDATTSKIIVNADININPANLSGLVSTNPATYPTGYPPVYSNPAKNPASINIGPTYANFSAMDDLPAFVYSIGVVDVHGSMNISGVVYTPSYIEIENKNNGTQYIKGAVIMGHGIFFENGGSGTSIISFDQNTLNFLATSNNVGKQVKVAYWQ